MAPDCRRFVGASGLVLTIAWVWASPLAAQACRDQGPELVVETNTANTTKSANLEQVLAFIDRGAYLSWPHDPYIRPTGQIFRKPDGSLMDGSTHHRVRIYYSPRVAEWLEAGRPTPEEWRKQGKNPSCYLPDGATIVKEMYKTDPPVYPAEDPVIGWAVMARKNGASPDGWFWTIYFREEFRSMDTMGTFSYSFCYTCHGSTQSESTFASAVNLRGENAASIEQISYIAPVQPTFFAGATTPSPSPSPLPEINRAFVELYRDPATYPGGKVPEYAPTLQSSPFPSSDFDHVWNRTEPATKSYLTSDNCIGCHDATSLVDTQVPNMMIRHASTDNLKGTQKTELLNLSVYGEWRASPMGMAGRDPVFYAQLESEMNTYPAQAAVIENTCLTCHGAMGQRQFAADTGKQDFKMKTVFQTVGTDAPYAALARDGISCMVCHQMDPETVNAKTNTGHFGRGPWAVIYASTPKDSEPGGPIRTWPMAHALDFTPTYNAYVNQSEACGVCHTIVLPVDNPDIIEPIGEAHEQDTFLEWFYSAYQNSNPRFPVAPDQAQTCQDCHMNATFQGNGQKVNFKVANVENTSWPEPLPENLGPADEITVPPRPEVGRHTFFGMNLFVLSFYDQFADLFGLMADSNPPGGTTDSFQYALQNGAWQIRNETAELEIVENRLEGEDLVVKVRVLNKAGHRLPSGVGFRRAWLELAVFDSRNGLLWTSGRADKNGVIVDPEGRPLASEFTEDPNRLQPHWEVITRQDQVQIYEERYTYKSGMEKAGRLNTSFLGINDVVKDNRLLPKNYYYKFIHEQAAERPGDDEFESLLPTSALPPAEGALDPRKDPAYFEGTGTDLVTYRIPRRQLEDAAQVRVALNYQSLPPYYLRDRFAAGQLPGGGSEQVQRLYYLAGHLNVQKSPIQGWKIRVQETSAPVPRLSNGGE